MTEYIWLQPVHDSDPSHSPGSQAKLPTLPSAAPGRKGTVHVENLHPPGAGIAQETAAVPTAASAAAALERQAESGRSKRLPPEARLPGDRLAWLLELQVSHVRGCCEKVGRGASTEPGESTPTPGRTLSFRMGWPSWEGTDG